LNRVLTTPPRPPLSVWQRIQSLRETLMAYLPLLMLSLLFLFSVWLVRSVAPLQNTPPTAQPLHTADYDFQNFHLKTYEMNGQLKSSMHGEFAQHFQDSLATEVKTPFVLIYSKNRVISAQAKKAIVNEDGSQVQLMGSVLLKRDDARQAKDDMQISGEFLHFFANTDTLQTHLPVNIVRGQNRFKADQLHADNINQIYDLQGRVHATLVPTQE
jgi:lipopolysaccharide export system protein LptC